jgi:hypothetical protein
MSIVPNLVPSDDPASRALRLACACFFVFVISIALSACSPASASSSPPTITPTVIGSTTTAIPPNTPPLVAIAVPTDTLVPTATSTATPTQRASVAVSPRETPTPSIPAGVYATAIKIEPAPAKSDEPPQFTVTFLNTTGVTQTYRWFVKVYQQDQPKSFGETSKTDSDIPTHTAQLTAAADWKTTTVVQCLFLIARVFSVDDNNQVHEFLKPDGYNPATGFYVCP